MNAFIVRKRWDVEESGALYVVDVEHHRITGSLRVFVNGERAYSAGAAMVIGEHSLRVGGHAVELTIDRPSHSPLSVSYTLRRDWDILPECAHSDGEHLLRPTGRLEEESLLRPASGAGAMDAALLRPASED